VGTADCGLAQIRFYERNGFVKYAIRKDFFIKNYELPIYENGQLLKDMIMLKYTLNA
jgi:aminoglycoside 6'-N-acetyltransferase I